MDFLIIETDKDSNSPMIGQIKNVSPDKAGREKFTAQFCKAIETRFCIDFKCAKNIPDIFGSDVSKPFFVTGEDQFCKDSTEIRLIRIDTRK
jgi:hypothetical protein